jgi:HEAT repeat protein
MSDFNNSVASLVAQLGTPADVDAFHELIEFGPQVISILVSTFRNEHRPTIRTRLVEVISQFRDPNAVEFLELALDDPDATTWKAALDGLVSLGGPAGFDALHRARQREVARGD